MRKLQRLELSEHALRTLENNAKAIFDSGVNERSRTKIAKKRRD